MNRCDDDDERDVTIKEIDKRFAQLAPRKERTEWLWALGFFLAGCVVIAFLTLAFRYVFPVKPQPQETSADIKALVSALQPALQQQQDNLEGEEDKVAIVLAKAKEEHDARVDAEHERETLSIKSKALMRERGDLLAQIEKLKAQKEKVRTVTKKCEVPERERVQALQSTSERMKLVCWEGWEPDPTGLGCWKKNAKKGDPKALVWKDEVDKNTKRPILSADPATGEPKLIEE